MPKSEEPITQTTLQDLMDWAYEFENYLNSICNQTKEVLATSKVEAQNYKRYCRIS